MTEKKLPCRQILLLQQQDDLKKLETKGGRGNKEKRGSRKKEQNDPDSAGKGAIWTRIH